MPFLITVRALRQTGILPSGQDPWPPIERRVVMREHQLSMYPAGPPFPPGSLTLGGLPRPGGGTLDVPIERLAFHRSPGRWHFRCPCCGELKGVLVEVAVGDSPPRATAVARALGWACRICAGLPASRAWPLSPAQRLDNALDRAGEIHRRPGEKARDWRRRRERAAKAQARMGKAITDLVDRADRLTRQLPP